MSLKQNKKPSISELYQIGDFVDAKDNQGDWRVGQIIDKSDITKTFKIRFDGWASKYDQFYRFGHPKLCEFRSVVLGYTGQKQNPAIRPNWKFQLKQHQKKLIQLNNYAVKYNEQRIKTAHQFNQWIRGHNYLYVDFLMTINFSTVDQIHKAIQFFKLNIYLTFKYLKKIAENFQASMSIIQRKDSPYLQDLQAAKAFAFYQIFDMMYIITGNYQRLQGFFKQNQQLLRQDLAIASNKDVKLSYKIKIAEIFLKFKGFQIIQLILKQLIQHKRFVPYVFLHSFAHLYSGVSSQISSKGKESAIKQFKQITQKQISFLSDKQLKDFYHQEALQFLSQIHSLSQKTSLERQIEDWISISQMQIYYKMIMCPYFQKKLRGITSFQEFIEQKVYLIEDGTIIKWIQQKKLFDVLLLNDNPELIKKSTQLIKFLYTKNNSMEKYIQLAWKCREGKHQTALKQIYSFMGEVPIYDKNQNFTIQLFKKHISSVSQANWDVDYIKMIKDYTINALPAVSNLDIKQTFGFKILYQYLQKNQGDTVLLGYLIQILQKLQKSQFLQRFIVDCFICIEKQINSSFHLILLLKILRQKIADIRNLKIDPRIIVQKNIILKKNDEKQNLSQKFQLLNEVLKQVKQIIPLQQFIDFWNQMIESKGKQYFFKWLYKVRDSGKVTITSFINYETKKYLIQNFWDEDYFKRYPQLDECEGIFLLQLFKTINYNEDKIKRSSLTIQVLDIDLIGIEKLHFAYEVSNNQKTVDVLAKGLTEIYMSGSQVLYDQNINLVSGLVQRITSKTRVFMAENKVNGIKKMIKLIEELILRDQQLFDINQTCRTFSIKQFIVKNVQTNEEKPIKYNVFQYLYNFKKFIAQKFGIVIHKFDLAPNDHQIYPIESYFKSIGQLDIKGKILLKPRNNQASIIKSQLNHQLQLLFQLLGNQEIQEQVWNIVSKLPISNQLRVRILQSQNPLNVLKNASFYKQLYMFKVALSLQKKWWNIQITQIINFFLLKLQNTLVNTQIQRQYLMVTLKILQQIIRQDQKVNINQLKQTFLKVFQILKKLLIVTNKIQNFNTFYVKKFIQTFFLIGQAYNKHIQKNNLKQIQIDSLSLMLEDKQIANFLKQSLIQYKKQTIRKQFPVKLVKLASINRQKYCQKLANIIFGQMLDFSVTFQNKNLRQFTSFACFILQTKSIYLQKFYSNKKSYYFVKLFKLIENQKNQQNNEITNVSLYCYLSLIRFVIQQVQEKQLEKLFQYIYSQCMFKGNQSKCKTKDSRNALFNLFIKLIKHKKIQQKIIQTFGKLHRNGIWRTRKLQDWIITQTQRLKSSTGYSGIRNLGCICYMNSFIQQIFMIEEFRLSLLLASDPFYNPNQIEDNVFYQMKKMFLNLVYSDRKAYNPKSFCVSFKDYEGNPTNVSQQMDIQQFSGILFDRLQNSMKGTIHAPLIKNTFGGIFSNEIICKGCPHFSQSEQSFLSLSLTVKDKKSIYESLDAMIKGDTLDGDNAYHCERCDKKVSAVKRVCLKSLPDYLIVTLKRFEFDYNTMTKLKVNDYCEFPHQMNLQEYSYEYLRKKENPKLFQGQQLRSKKYYQYKLKGVVIHMGYADSGHYYSLIQQRNGEQKWLQFNDTIVRKFNIQNLNDQAFGGETGGLESKQKIKNAYMLIYERVEKLNTKKQQILRSQNSLKSIQMYQNAFQIINQENFQYNIESILFSPQYLRFMNSLIDEAGRKKENIQLQKFVILAFLTVTIRSKVDPGTLQNLQKIYISFSSKNIKINEWILQQFCDQNIYEEFFRNCPIKQIKRIISSWIVSMFQQCNDNSLKIKFLKLIVKKITKENQNTVQPIMILHRLIDQDLCLSFLIQNNIIGRLNQNIIRKQPRVFGSIQNLNHQTIVENFFGHQQIIQKTVFELKKMKYQNDTGIVWALIYQIIKRVGGKNIHKVLHPKQIQYLYLTKDKIYKLLQEAKCKFNIQVLTDYLTFLAIDNQDFSQDLINMIQKGLKEFQSKRYRQFFILFSKIIAIEDNYKEERVRWIHNIIRSLKQNQKYAMDCTIIQLWICKIVNENRNLQQYLMKQKTASEYLASLPLKKIPSDELSKKNSNFGENSVSKYHGIPFPHSRRGYSKVLRQVQQFYQKLQKGISEPIHIFQSGNSCVYDKLSIGDKIAFFDVKDKIDYQEAVIKDIFLDKLCLSRKSSPNKFFWVWIDDEKLTSNLKVIKQDHQNQLDSSKTTQMEDQIDFQGVS